MSKPIDYSKFTEKQIDYAYPSSPNAIAGGCGKEGCWVISVANGNNPAVALFFHPTEEDAIALARHIPLPFGRLWEAKYSHISSNPLNVQAGETVEYQSWGELKTRVVSRIANNIIWFDARRWIHANSVMRVVR